MPGEGRSEVAQAVVTILYDKSEVEIHDSEKALGKLGVRAEGALPALKYRWFTSIADPRALEVDYSALEALVAVGPDDPVVINEVLKLVSAPPKDRLAYNNRSEGLRHLDSIDAPNAKKVAALVAALADPESRLAVVRRLERYGADAKPALPALMGLTLDGDVKVRDAAAKAVEKISAAK